jgi:hypothetical protein
MTNIKSNRNEPQELSEVWIQLIVVTLPSGTKLICGSVPLEEWITQTKQHNIKSSRYMNKTDEEFMLTLSHQLQQIAEHLEPGETYEHKGFTLYRVEEVSAQLPKTRETTSYLWNILERDH